MKKLFIIGNGFDLAHKLPTSYYKFRDYLKDKVNHKKELSGYYITVPDSYLMPDGDEAYNDSEAALFLLDLIENANIKGDKWMNFEEALGELELWNYFDDYFDDDDNEWHEVCRNEDKACRIRQVTLQIKKYFSDWISKVDISIAKAKKEKAKKEFQELIDHDNDIFLTFNYTRTLEEFYKVKNVCHIHGQIGGDIIVGHGNNEDNYIDDIRFIGAENILSELHNDMKKDVQNIIRNNMKFFGSLGEVKEVYSYGFSFSDVDMAYIEIICHKLKGKKAVWYLHDFPPKEDLEIFKGKLRLYFDGKIRFFHI